MKHHLRSFVRFVTLILLLGITISISGCKITIDSSSDAGQNDSGQIATGVQEAVQAKTEQAQNADSTTASAVQDVSDGTPQIGLVIIDPQTDSSTNPAPSDTLAPGAPSLTPKPPSQLQVSATSPGGGALPLSKPSSTPAMGALPSSTPGMQSIITDTPSGIGILVTDTPSIGFLPSNTPGGMAYLPSSTATSSIQYLPTSPPTTPQGAVPKAPTNFKFLQWSGKPSDGYILAEFTWTDTADNDEGYEIHYKENGTSLGQGVANATTGYEYISVNNLCNKHMTFYALYYNKAGKSPPSNEIILTGPCPPNPPSSLELYNIEYDYDSDPNHEKYHFRFYAPADQGGILFYHMYGGETAYRELGVNEFYFTITKECYVDYDTLVYVTAWGYGGASAHSNEVISPKPTCMQPSGHGG